MSKKKARKKEDKQSLVKAMFIFNLFRFAFDIFTFIVKILKLN